MKGIVQLNIAIEKYSMLSCFILFVQLKNGSGALSEIKLNWVS